MTFYDIIVVGFSEKGYNVTAVNPMQKVFVAILRHPRLPCESLFEEIPHLPGLAFGDSEELALKYRSRIDAANVLKTADVLGTLRTKHAALWRLVFPYEADVRLQHYLRRYAEKAGVQDCVVRHHWAGADKGRAQNVEMLNDRFANLPADNRLFFHGFMARYHTDLYDGANLADTAFSLDKVQHFLFRAWAAGFHRYVSKEDLNIRERHGMHYAGRLEPMLDYDNALHQGIRTVAGHAAEDKALTPETLRAVLYIGS